MKCTIFQIMANKKLKKRSLSEGDRSAAGQNDSTGIKIKKQKAENTVENGQPLKKSKKELALKKIKTEPGLEVKSESGISKTKVIPKVKVKSESGIKVKTEPGLKIKTESGLNTGEEQTAEKNTGALKNLIKNEKKKKNKQVFQHEKKINSEASKTKESTDVKSEQKSNVPINKTESKLSKYSAEELKQKILAIENKGALTKTAKRKLAKLQKKLKITERTEGASETKPVQKIDNSKKNKKQNENSAESNVTVQSTENKKAIKNKVKGNKGLQDAKKSGKTETSIKLQAAKKKQKTKNKHQSGNIIKTEIKEESDDEDDEDDEDDIEEDEDSNDMIVEEEKDEIEKEDDDDEEEDEEEEEEEKDDDDDDDDEDSNDEEDKPKKQDPKMVKKKRYVLFVGNLPYDATPTVIKDHFMTKVSSITDIRIPKMRGSNKPRGFAYIEFPDQENYEKALALKHTFINGRRINVYYTTKGKDNKAKVIAKNKKLDALHKAGKLAGSKPKNKRKQKKPQPSA